MKILGDIFPENKVITIAEIGINHNGSVEIALQMIEKAAKAGADAVKFQTFVAEKFYSVYTNSLLKFGSEKEEDYSQIDFFSKFCLTKDDLILLKKRAEELNIVFFSSPFDEESVNLLEEIEVKLYKIASSELTNIKLLEYIAKTQKPVILSTGMSNDHEISNALQVLKGNDVVLMHCVSLYPLENENVNLQRMVNLKTKYNCIVGFSDHSSTRQTSVYAAYMGAQIIEKHFKLSTDNDCPDSIVSLDEIEFTKLVAELKESIVIKGNGEINYQDKEHEVARASRKSIYVKDFIPADKIIEESDIIFKRPGLGIAAYDFAEVIGKKSKIDLKKDYLIKSEYLY